MKKVKAIKGVPKYNVGTNGITPDLTLSKPQYSFDPNQLGGTTAPSGFSFNENWADMTTNQKMGAVSGAVGGAASLYNMAASGQKPTVGTALSGIATGASAGSAFGPIGAGVGAFMGLLAGTAGSKYHVNRDAITTTSDVSESVEGGGWLSWFGPSKGSQIRKATGIQNSKMAYEQTANARVDYANDPRNQPVTVSAKDGGVIPELVHAKVSKGELYYDPYNKTLSRVPGSPDKPNTDDDVDAFLAKGGMVVTNNNKQPLINGKTQAIALAPMVDKPNKNMSKGTIEARDRIIKKVTRLNDLSKTENNRIDNVVYADTGNANIGNNENQLLNWLREKTKGTILGKNLNPPVDGDTRSELEKVRDRMKEWRETGTYFEVADPQQESNQPESNQGGFGHRNLSLTTNGAGGFKPTNKFGYLGPRSTRQLLYNPNIDYTSQFEGWDKFYTKPVVSKSTGATRSGSSKTSSNKETVTKQGNNFRVTDSPLHRYGYTPLSIVDKAEQITTPDKIDINRIKKDIEYLDGQSEDDSTSNKSNFDLSDLYRSLSAIAPLFDRVRPRTTTLNRPTFKPIPVDVDPTNLLQDAQLGYALNNYNTSRGGFTAGQQLAAANVAASNLATQRANIHQWEKEQELKNITQNIMSYNDYSKLLAEIGNTEIDINDRNRAAANTINDTNRKSALNTLGSIAKEMKQEKIDAQDRERKYTMLEPLIREVYENSDELLPLLQGKIKKVKKTKKSTKTKKA